MKFIVTIVLVLNLLFVAIWPKMDSQVLPRLSFLITHSVEHFQENDFSVWQLICHYADKCDAESKQPTDQKQNMPFRCPSCQDFTASSLSFEYSFSLDCSDAADLKYSSYQFTVTSEYNGSIFHPPKH